METGWLAMMTMPEASGSAWTDAWLAALSIALGAKLVSFDAGMRRWSGIDAEVLVGTVL